MKNDLLHFGFDHTVRFDVIMTLAFFENLRLKHGCLFQFESNQFYLVANVLTHGKTLKVLAVIV